MEIKLIIWDLDDTLWNGTLAEGEKLTLNSEFANLIKRLNERGVVSSICSKNDFQAAKHALEHFGLWEEFVFSSISFSPKGPAVSNIIEQMQLRACNVLFIDDNPVNLGEIKSCNPEINIADPHDKATLKLLEGLVLKYNGVQKSRISKYRALEARQSDFKLSTGSREDFLRGCEITLAIVERNDNAEFSERIEELINRTNQMNFTKSRVEPGSLKTPLLTDGSLRPYSVFAWDKYGYHGLVGFALVEKRKTLRHFLFSCRIMHMGIEQRILYEIARHYDHPQLDIGHIPVKPEPSPWISLVSFVDPDVRAKIRSAEKTQSVATPSIRVIANCQSSAIAHFGGFASRADADNWPRVFNLQHFSTGVLPKLHERSSPYNDAFAPAILYLAGIDYFDDLWSPEFASQLEAGFYTDCARKFGRFVSETGRKAIIILPPSEDRFIDPGSAKRGITKQRIEIFNREWIELAKRNLHLSVFRLGDAVEGADLVGKTEEFSDFVHYSPALLRRIGLHTAEWLSVSGQL